MNRYLNTKTIVLTTLLVSTGFLAGCSKEPSEDDIKTAYRNEVEQTNSLAHRLGGDALSIKVNDLKKLGCKATDQKAQYLCQVEIDTTLPLLGVQHTNTSLTLGQGDTGNGQQGWVVIRNSSD